MKKLHAILIAAAMAAMLVAPQFLKNFGVYLMSYWLVFIIATMGLNLTVGYAGQKSLGHAAFLGIGAYTMALVLKAGFSFWLGLPVAAALCFVVGLALGFPALRVQTIYLAFATLGFNTAIWLVMRNEEWLTGGTFGINNIPRPSLFGLSLEGNRPTTTSCWRWPRCWRCCCGACCARRGARPSRRCATTRSVPKASASACAATRC